MGLLILLLSCLYSNQVSSYEMRTAIEPDERFSVCNTMDGHVACAIDAPDKSVIPNLVRFESLQMLATRCMVCLGVQVGFKLSGIQR